MEWFCFNVFPFKFSLNLIDFVQNMKRGSLNFTKIEFVFYRKLLNVLNLSQVNLFLCPLWLLFYLLNIIDTLNSLLPNALILTTIIKSFLITILLQPHHF